MAAEDGDTSEQRIAYRAVSVPFMVLAVVFFLTGNVGLGAAFIAIGTAFLAVDGARGSGEKHEDAGDDV